MHDSMPSAGRHRQQGRHDRGLVLRLGREDEQAFEAGAPASAKQALVAVPGYPAAPRAGSDAAVAASSVLRPSAAVGRRFSEGKALLLAEVALVLMPAALTEISLPLALVAYAVAAATWRAQHLYERRFSLSMLDDVAPLALGAAIAAAPALVVGVGALDTQVTPALGAVVAMLGAVVIARSVCYAVILRLRRSGRLSYPTVILGAGPVALGLARRIEGHPESGLRLVGFLDGGEARQSLPAPLLGAADDLARVVQQRHVSDVLIGYGKLPTSELVEVLRSCDRFDVEFHLLPRLFEMHRLTRGCDHLWGIPLIRVRRRAHRTHAWRVKRLVDLTVAATALLLLAPVLAATALAVRLEVGPGIFFKQERIGLDGRRVTIRKFSSMRPLPKGVANPWSVTDSDRIGPVGRLIRRYSLDELPQLFNVLAGDMSLVGPRPERPEYVEQFRSEVPRYGDRHRVPVGLTGLAAVHGLRGDTSISERAYFGSATFAEALRHSVQFFDGSFSYLAATASELGFAKDPFGFKPLIVAESDDYIAIATEEVALRAVCGADVETWEPPAGTVQTWNVCQEREQHAASQVLAASGAVAP